MSSIINLFQHFFARLYLQMEYNILLEFLRLEQEAYFTLH